MKQLEIDPPHSIEWQREKLLESIKSEQERIVRPEDVEKMEYLKRCYIMESQLEPYDLNNIKQAKNRLSERLKKRRE